MLVLINATPEGRKELVGFHVSARESAQSWRELLIEVERRGLQTASALRSGTARSEALLGFYDFPAEHWGHLRTSNPVESVFATVRHRTVRTRGSLSSTMAKLMLFKLVMAASKTWRRLQGQNQLPKVIEDGMTCH